MRIAFSFLLVIHGLIHLMGFVKGFQLAEMAQLRQPVSALAGVFWLLTCLLFLASGGLFFAGKHFGWILLLPAILLSQTLIIQQWQDAKFGTIANIVALIGLVLAFGAWRFDKMVSREKQAFLSVATEDKRLKEEELAPLPPVVQRWVRQSGAVGQPRVYTVHLKQSGRLRTQKEGDWLPFQAEQYFTVDHPGFIWIAGIQAMPMVEIVGRDKYENGRGNMRIELMSLFQMVNATGPEIDQGSLLRYLAEICWFPDAALQPYIQWDSVGLHAAQATMTYGDIRASGVFYFNESDDLLRFEAKRYYSRKEGATLEDWQIVNHEWKTLNGLRIPVRSEVIWKLKDGDYSWLTLEITDIHYNEHLSGNESLRPD